MKKPNNSNRVLLHILKNNPRDGEVYITWEGETFCGAISSIEVSRRPDEPGMFSISGFIRD
jgi:hypothetical protein